MKTIEITPEMEQRARRYHLALRFLGDAQTEASAGFFRASAERHRVELGGMLADAIAAEPTLADTMAMMREMGDAQGVEIAVAVSVVAREEACAE